MHVDLAKLKTKWAELQDVMTSAAEHESAFMKKIKNLEAHLLPKIKEVAATDEKKVRMEERLKRVIEQNREHAKTNIDLSGLMIS